MADCLKHSGLEKAIKVLEETDKSQWAAINAMRSWVVAGMGALLLQCIVFIGGVIFKKLGL